jgi:hypothetical protein
MKTNMLLNWAVSIAAAAAIVLLLSPPAGRAADAAGKPAIYANLPRARP